MMKNFVFAMFGFWMLLSVSVNVQACVSEPISPKMDVLVTDVGAPAIQNDVVEVAPVNCLVVAASQLVFSAETPVVRSRLVTVPKCPFRYVLRSKYCNHYSYTAYSRLITPY